MNRRRLTAGVVIAVVVNLILGALYLTSSNGQTTVLELTVRGDSYRAVFDGRQVVPPITGSDEYATLAEAPASGSIAVILPYGVPSLPRPSGVDSVEVLDPSGKVLFRDDFAFLDRDRWLVTGSLDVKDGVLIDTDKARSSIAHLQGANWTDYTLRVTYRNSIGGTAVIRLNDRGDGVYYIFELQRDFPNFMNVLVGNQSREFAYGGLIQTSEQQTTKSMLAMILRPYPLILLALGVMVLCGVGQALWPARGRASSPSLRWPYARVGPAVLVVSGLALLAFLLTYYLNREYYGFIPHVPDEVSYMFEAKLLAAGHFTGEIPPMKDAFYFYQPNFLYEVGDRWATFYPYGHPAMLAIGAFLGLINFVPALVGGACVVLIYLIGRRLYDDRVGVLTAVLLAGSPFFLMQASSFMSHNTAMFFMLVSLLFILKRDKLWFGAIAGLAFGLMINTRPLTAIMLVPPFGLLLLSYGIDEAKRIDAAKYLGAFIAGVALGILGYLIYNYGITGDPLSSPASGSDPSSLLGFNGGHTFAVGLRNEQAQVQSLLLVLSGWPVWVGLMFVLMPFVLGTRNRWDYFCLACLVLPAAAYVLYRYSGVYDGPRYWYEVVPFFLFLTVRGIDSLVQFAGTVADEVGSRLNRPADAPSWPARTVMYSAVVLLFVWGTAGWLFDFDKGWTEANHPLVPDRPAAMRHLFGVDDRLVDLSNQQPLHDALVLVRPCGFFESLACYGSVFLKNGSDFDGDVVWARYIRGRNEEIIAAFPGRTVYVANWDGVSSIVPYDAEADH